MGGVWLIEPDGEGGMRDVPGAARCFAAVESAGDARFSDVRLSADRAADPAQARRSCRAASVLR